MIGAMVGAGCTNTPPEIVVEGTACSPGATQECLCGPGQVGVQVCEDEGLAWGTCDCQAPPDGGAEGGGRDGAGDEAGPATGEGEGEPSGEELDPAPGGEGEGVGQGEGEGEREVVGEGEGEPEVVGEGEGEGEGNIFCKLIFTQLVAPAI